MKKQQQKQPALSTGQLRQGDVLLVRVLQIARGTEQPSSGERLVLRHGEATGHAHAFYEADADSVSLFESADKERHLKVLKSAYLTHEEHERVLVRPGLYDLPQQVEWTDEDEPRQIAD